MIKKLFSFFVCTLMLSAFIPAIKTQSAATVPSVQNPGFETLDASGGADGWIAPGGWNGNYVTLDNTTCHAGNYSAKLTKTGDSHPYVQQTVPVTPHTVYEIHLWVRHDTYSLYEDSRNLRLRYQFYSDASASSASYLKYDETYSEGFTPPQGIWKQKTLRVTSPENARALKLGIYLLEKGSAWIDDIEIIQKEAPLRFTLDTDCVFYYPDQKTGVAKVALTKDYTAELANASVSFALMDGKKELTRQASVPFTEGKAYFYFDPSLLTYKKKAYTIQAILYSQSGQAIEVRRTEVYKYDRPTLFDEDGYMTVNGTRFIPTVGYHSYKILDEAKTHGVNVIQTGNGFVQEYLTNKEQFVTLLDEIYAQGMRAFVSLYAYMLFPSDAKNRDAVTAVITDLKDHPAIYCWGVMDEPFDMFSDPREGLRESYKLIRNLDDKHPVMVMVNDSRFYEEGAKYCDVFAHDPYPPSPYTGAEPANHVQTITAHAVRATSNAKKPVLTVNQAYTYHDYTPSVTDARNMWYQALMGGTQGCGHYAIDEMLEIPDLKKGILEFAKEEQAFSYRFFSSEAIPFNQDINNDFSYKISILDEKPYLLVLNRSNENKTVGIPLTSRNGKGALASGQLTPLYGADSKNIITPSENGTVSVSLTPRQAVIYRIDNVVVQTADLYLQAFSDLNSYPADKASVEYLYANHKLEAAGNGLFSPDAPITRGAFADLLVKTLGLSVVKELRPANYADIASDAFYANAVHIARYFDLFKETSGKSFYPEAAITRAEAFSAFARGLEITAYSFGQENPDVLLSLWDRNSIPQYAEHPITRLIGAGLLAEDADHAIRPLQSLTRIEAANLAARVLGAAPSSAEIMHTIVAEEDRNMLSADETKILNTFFDKTMGLKKDAVWKKLENIDGKWYGIIQNLTNDKKELALFVPSDSIFVLCGMKRGVLACEAHLVSLSIEAGRTVLYEILPSSQPECIPNENFEYAMGNMPCEWTVPSSVSSDVLHLVNDSTCVKSGQFALQAGNNTTLSGTDLLSTESSAFAPGTLYQFSAWVKTQIPAEGKVTTEAYLVWLNENDEPISGYEACLTDTEKTTSGWKKLNVLTEAPQTAKKFRITLRYTGIGVLSGIYYWDDFSLVPADNYILNGNFSEKSEGTAPLSWKVSGGTLKNEDDPIDGDYLSLSGANSYAETNITASGLSGKMCKLSLCYRTDAKLTSTAVCLRGIWSSNAHHIAVSLPPTGGQWQEYSLRFILPSGHESFRLRLYTEDIGDTDVHFDKIMLTSPIDTNTVEIYTNGHNCIVHPTQNLTPVENLGWSIDRVIPGQTVTLRAPQGFLSTRAADFYIGFYTQTNTNLRKLQALIAQKDVKEMQYGGDVKDMGYCATFTLPDDLPAGHYSMECFVWEAQSMRPSPHKMKMELTAK